MNFKVIFLLTLDCFNILNYPTNQNGYYNIGEIKFYSCFFQRNILYNGNGGVVSITSFNSIIQIVNSVFYLCKCSGNGGSIFIQANSNYCELILNKICSYGSSASMAFFCYTQVTNDINYKNY